MAITEVSICARNLFSPVKIQDSLSTSVYGSKLVRNPTIYALHLLEPPFEYQFAFEVEVPIVNVEVEVYVLL